MKAKSPHPLSPGYLSRPGEKWRKIGVLDLAVLIEHVYRGALHPEVGYADSQRTLDTLIGALNKAFWLDPSLIQSALWSCNLLHEQGSFSHPKGLKFEDWVKRFLNPGEKFDPTYHLFVKEKEATSG